MTGSQLGERFLEGMKLALEIHGETTRKATRIPYLAHLMSVSALVLEHGGDEDCAVAGLLHDAVEDSEDGAATERRICEKFGDRVARLVLACSDAVAVPGEPKPDWRKRKLGYLERLATEEDQDALLISACDKPHNVRCIVADLRVVGDEVWQRFTTRSRADQLWYYCALLQAYKAHGVPSPLTDELRRVIYQM